MCIPYIFHYVMYAPVRISSTYLVRIAYTYIYIERDFMHIPCTCTYVYAYINICIFNAYFRYIPCSTHIQLHHNSTQIPYLFPTNRIHIPRIPHTHPIPIPYVFYIYSYILPCILQAHAYIYIYMCSFAGIMFYSPCNELSSVVRNICIISHHIPHIPYICYIYMYVFATLKARIV